MPQSVARQLYRQTARPLPPEGLATTWNSHASTQHAKAAIVSEDGGSGHVTGACDVITPFPLTNLNDVQPAVVKALRESQLCQGNPYLAEAVDGLLHDKGGTAAAGSSPLAAQSATLWVVTSAGGSAAAGGSLAAGGSAAVCAAAVTRVALPRATPLAYGSARLDYWRMHGHRLAAASLQIQYMCWRAGMSLQSRRALLARLVEQAHAWSCASIWTQLRQEEAPQIAFLRDEGFMPQDGQLYVLKL